MSKRLDLPNCFEHLRPRVEKTLTPFVRISAEKGLTGRFDSKFGGDPYLPLGFEYPLDETGAPMKLLAQINFGQVPPIPNFPISGILQFYLSVKDELYGSEYEDRYNQKNFRVIYFDDIRTSEKDLLTDFEFTKLSKEDVFPISSGCEAKLSFTKAEEFMSLGDFRLERECGINMNGWEAELDDFYVKCSESSMGHKIGGYAGFTQHDPRSEVEVLSEHTQLLFQIDSDDNIDCSWDDAGVGNFFIREDDLIKKNFTRVFFNFDSH